MSLQSGARVYQGQSSFHQTPKRNGFTERPVTADQKVEVHEHALDILRFRGVQVPGADIILNTNWSATGIETSISVKHEIEELRRSQGVFLSKIYDLHATAYLDDVEDRYRSRNEVLDIDPKQWMKKAYTDNPKAMHVDYTQDEIDAMTVDSEAQKTLYATSRPYPFSPTAPNPSYLPSISRHNYDYLRRLLALQNRLKTVKERERIWEEQERARKDQELYNERRRAEERILQEQREREALERKFPTTIAEFESKNKDLQNLVARFLSSKKGVQDKMLTDLKWDAEEVKPLMRIYDKNDQFRTRLMAMSMFAGPTTDPRRRV